MQWQADGTLVMVEDSDEDFRVFERVFRDFGPITRWSSGEAALRRLSDPAVLEACSVVFVDMHLPGMDGPEVMRRIRELPGGAETTVIAYSGSGLEDDILAALDAGADEYEVKPDDLAGLRLVAQRAAALAGAPGASATR